MHALLYLVQQAGLGWRNSIKDDKIRSSSDLKNEIAMPADYERLISRNQPDVEVRRGGERGWVVEVQSSGAGCEQSVAWRDCMCTMLLMGSMAGGDGTQSVLTCTCLSARVRSRYTSLPRRCSCST